ncbi:MAG TPA: HlyD family efflux transporter periplasmic adaptor subunit [Bryobacteraceae bacterium]|nr:HlyD family efflux transporter periplasmic adaptor subunit [Bryobacteraceae bacterium]HOQ44013.1 HlyD family efflux transporter periplasmic adaptor subunit [Bryobacteraceae bacterium]HPQ13850.1 HlyD family efflux transporter periplasmic adaptor subunit [Bryobacteraceae bacterium]HPU70331.1 HlyD family efflux transporter periplasmic adaptor subunit [Bryobacteraceae bacterium]
MDIPRKDAARRKRIRQTVVGAVVLAAIAAVTMGVMRLKPAAPTVEWATVWPDTVKRGPMLRQVRGLGTLVPEDILWIPATTDGRVEQRLALPGTVVKPDTVLIILSNPELQQALVDAEWKLKAAEAELENLKVKLESERLNQEAQAASVASEANKAKLEADRNAELNRFGLIADIEAKKSLATALDWANRQRIEAKRLEIALDSIRAQLAVQKANVEQLRALYELKKSQVDALTVRAGVHGVLQQVPVEVGQRVTVGTNLARVVQPEKLKAELKIPETQAKDVALGQKAEVDTRNGVIPGRVSRIDPAAVEGTVTVDVELEGPLPPGARPDLSVDGTIEIEKLDDVLYVGRPTSGEPNSVITLFKVDPDRKGATAVKVKLGRSSVNTIEILEGLNVGDQVILSDMSAWMAYERIRLN